MLQNHLIGIALAVVAFLVFGHGIVRRSKGNRFNPIPAFLLILVAIAYQFLFSSGGIFESLPSLLTDLGLGMIIASAYLSIKRVQPKLFWVPGLLAFVLGAGLYIFSFSYQWISKQVTHDYQLLVELGEDDDISEIEHILERYHANWEKAFPAVDLDEDKDLAQYYLVSVSSGMKDGLEEELSRDKENVDQFAPQ